MVPSLTSQGQDRCSRTGGRQAEGQRLKVVRRKGMESSCKQRKHTPTEEAGGAADCWPGETKYLERSLEGLWGV